MAYTSGMPALSIVIPAFNEELRLPVTLETVHTFCSEQGFDFEIVVVNDGSLDGTTQVVEEFAQHHDGLRLLTYSTNRGKGHAVKEGVTAALGAAILVIDADGSTPIEEYAKLGDAISGGADIAIGSRNKPSDETIVKALAYRTYVGNLGNRIIQTLVLPGIYDTQCGFKLFKNTVAKDIFGASTIEGYGFDVEILFIAKLRNYKLEEIPVNWQNVAGSKVNVVRDSIKVLFEVLRIYLNGLSGRYHRRTEVTANEYERHSR
jgi:dolichyl-phosphate beta-glucosyltransferase